MLLNACQISIIDIIVVYLIFIVMIADTGPSNLLQL